MAAVIYIVHVTSSKRIVNEKIPPPSCNSNDKTSFLILFPFHIMYVRLYIFFIFLIFSYDISSKILPYYPNLLLSWFWDYTFFFTFKGGLEGLKLEKDR